MKGSRSKAASAVAAVGLVVLAALIGGAGTGGAAGTTLIVTLTGQISSISSGGTIGYEATVQNTGTSTVTHVSLVVETGAGTYRMNSTPVGPATCGPGLTTSSMLCTASQLAPFEKFTVEVAFKAPTVTSDSSLTATAQATVSANTNGHPGNPGTSTWPTGPLTTPVLVDSGFSFSTFSLPGDKVSSGQSLITALGFPATFNGHFGLITEVGEKSGDPLCHKCPAVFSNVSIPASLTLATNPFGLLNPYTFELTLKKSAQAPGYKPAGLFHLDESAVSEEVKLCSVEPLSVEHPFCLDEALSQNKKTGEIKAKGRGIENGSYGFG